MPRQPRLDAPGTLHHVIVRGIEKRPIFEDKADRDNFVSHMGRLAQETESPIYAWALLENHAHILLRSGPQGLPRPCTQPFSWIRASPIPSLPTVRGQIPFSEGAGARFFSESFRGGAASSADLR